MDGERRLPAENGGHRAPGRLGQYEIQGEIGRGGFGIVYRALQHPLERTVALKVLREGFTADAVERMRREAVAAGSFHHPNIVTVYEAGIDTERPFIAMQYVEGQTLAGRIQSGGLPANPDEPVPFAPLVAMIEKLALALHAAHVQKGIVHRDIKPENIIVQHDGEPVIVDFGLAKLREGVRGSISGSRHFLGTFPYMSPEQVRCEDTVDRRSDVYSLGVTLYEALTGRRPFKDQEEDPRTLERSILDRRPPPASRWNPRIPRDLEVILETALQKDPADRYQTALALAEDLRRYRERRPLRARPPGPCGRAWRWTRRHRTLAASVVGSLCLIAVGAVALTSFLRKGLQVEADLGRLQERFAASLPVDPGDALLAAVDIAGKKPGAESDERIVAALDILHEAKDLAGHTGPVISIDYGPDGSRVVTACSGMAKVWDLSTGKHLDLATEGPILGVHFAGDGRRLFVVGKGRAWVFDAANPSDRSPAARENAIPSTGGAISFSDDGERIAIHGDWMEPIAGRSPSENGRLTVGKEFIRILRLVHGEFVTVEQVPDAYLGLLCRDGSRSALALRNDKVLIRSTDPPKGIATLPVEGRVKCADFDPDGSRLAMVMKAGSAGAAEERWKLAIEEVEGKKVVFSKELDAPVEALRFSSDGGLLAMSSAGKVSLWNVATWSPRLVANHRYLARSLAFHPRGKEMVTDTQGCMAALWDFSRGATTLPVQDQVGWARFSPGRDRVFTLEGGKELKVYDTASGNEVGRVASKRPILGADVSRDGDRLIVLSKDGNVSSWLFHRPAGDGDPGLVDLFSVQAKPYQIFFVRNDTRICVVTQGKVLVHDPEGALLHAVDFSGSPLDYSSSGDGRHFMVASDHEVVIWSTEDWTRAPVETKGLWLLRGWSLDGLCCVVGISGRYGGGRGCRITDLSGRRQVLLPAPADPGSVMGCLGPDGRFLAFKSRGQIQLWNLEERKMVFQLPVKAQEYIRELRFSPDGDRLLAVSMRGEFHRLPVDPAREAARFGLQRMEKKVEEPVPSAPDFIKVRYQVEGKSPIPARRKPATAPARS